MAYVGKLLWLLLIVKYNNYIKDFTLHVISSPLPIRKLIYTICLLFNSWKLLRLDSFHLMPNSFAMQNSKKLDTRINNIKPKRSNRYNINKLVIKKLGYTKILYSNI